MPASLAADHPSPFGAALRALGLSLLGLAAILVFVFAAAAALVIGLVVASAALALHFMPRRAEAPSSVLEAHKTPNGWVVETSARR